MKAKTELDKLKDFMRKELQHVYVYQESRTIYYNMIAFFDGLSDGEIGAYNPKQHRLEAVVQDKP